MPTLGDLGDRPRNQGSAPDWVLSESVNASMVGYLKKPCLWEEPPKGGESSHWEEAPVTVLAGRGIYLVLSGLHSDCVYLDKMIKPRSNLVRPRLLFDENVYVQQKNTA